MDNLTIILIASIMILPLLGSLVTYVLGNKGAGMVLLTLFSLVFALSVYSFLNVTDPIEVNAQWITFKDYSFDIGLRYDPLAGIMTMVVSLIALLVVMFSIEYMKHDEGRARYFSHLGLFAFSMYGIVLSSNLLFTFVFWELVGFSSYLLIGFWYDQEKPPISSFKAFIMNKVGDAGFLLGIFILFAYFKTLNIQELVWSDFSAVPSEWVFLAGLGLFLAAVGKSAQFPLQSWLPDAMTGPTPVSALIHAATMVAAGVYLMVRVFPILSPDLLTVIGVIGGLTAFIGAFSAFAQNDIKKVLAYSTVSQLGYMVLALGAGFPLVAFFHLVTHAFFKAGLFLCSGSIIHYYHETNHDHSFDAQDIRNMGGLKKVLPVTFVVFTVCTLSLAGIPLFSGFLSKELILNGVLSSELPMIAVVFAFASVFMTAAYMSRLYFKVFFNSIEHKEKYQESVYTSIPLVVLAVLSVWVVFSFNPFGPESNWVSHSLESMISNPEPGHSMLVLVASISLATMGLLFSYLYVEKKQFVGVVNGSKKALYSLSSNSFYIDAFHRKVMAHGSMGVGQVLSYFDKKILDHLIDLIAKTEVVLAYLIAWFDKYIVDGAVNFIAGLSKFLGDRTRSVQSGNVQAYFVWALFGFLVIVYFLNF
ncbi:MAG: NADH-quinone oxidoreductase subunit L [Reichenbachiella sp.]